MKARPGDRIIIKGHEVGAPDRDALVVEVHGADGDPPYLVEWSADGHRGLLFPGPGARIQHLEHTTTSPSP